MTSIVLQGSSLGLGPTLSSPNPNYNSTFGSFDLVSSPVWWEAETNIRDFLPARPGTRFSRPCWWLHGSGWVCPGSAGSRSRPSDMNSGKLVFMSGAPKLASSNLSGSCSQALTLLGESRFIDWFLRRPFLGECQRGPKDF